jgi:hypothetical protein
MKERIDCGQAVNHAELAFEESTDLGAAECAGPILGERAGVDS